MREKVLVLITMIAVFFLLSDYTLKAKREGFEFAVEKKQFFFNNFEHDTSITGGWAARDYVITMKINSPDNKLNLKLVLKDKKTSGNVNLKVQDKYEKSKHGTISKFGMCAANATRPLNNGTCKPRPTGLMTRVYMTCQTTTGTVANWARNGAAWTWNVIFNVTLTVVDKVFSGVTCVADWCYARMKWLAYKFYSVAAFVFDWCYGRMKWLANKVYGGLALAMNWSWIQMKWLIDGAWDKATGMANWAWDGVLWLGGEIWKFLAWVGNGIANFYAEYLENHVTGVKNFLTDLTTKDGFILVAGIFIGSVSILLIKRAVKGYRERRQVRLEREAAKAAAAAAAAAKRRKRASMINQKNRHNKSQWKH